MKLGDNGLRSLANIEKKKDPQIRNNKKYVNYVMDQPNEDELT